MRRSIFRWFWIMIPFALLASMTACDPEESFTPYKLEIPENFPAPVIPMDNPLTEEKVNLGKALFFDPILSRDSSVSCASCHEQKLAFTDGKSLAIGIDDKIVPRNSMPLFNLIYAPELFWDGANPSLETQAIHPIVAENEMDADLNLILERLQRNSRYGSLIEDAYGEAINGENIAAFLVDALASYQRTLISGNSPYDRFVLGDSSALNEEEKRGMALFFNHERGECFHCHTEPFFTDFTYQNNGLYEEYKDEGRKRVTGRDNDEGKFKVPSLRNIEYTAPYMHDGSMASLEEVVDHYAKGGNKHRNQSILLDNIEFSESEKQDLIAFLKALSDDEFINNRSHQP